MSNLIHLSISCLQRFIDTNNINTTQHADRILKNISRLYARRVFELASISTSVMAMDRRRKDSSNIVTRPMEWSKEILLTRGIKFTDSFSGLGSCTIHRAWAAMNRIIHLTFLVSPLTILLPLSYVSGPNSLSSEIMWNYLIWSIEKAGPTFVKLVQWATTREDLFPNEFVKRCSILQDDTRGHSWNETKKILEESLGPGYSDILDFGDFHQTNGKEKGKICMFKDTHQHHKPIGSGCIAQVYKAKLKYGTTNPPLPAGTDVAVKVTHPNIRQKVALDFYILSLITELLEKLPKLNLDYLSINDSVAQFRDVMLPQLDLRIEARNLRRFRRDFANDERVSFPLPVDELTTSHVLVESFVNGYPILDLVNNVFDEQELTERNNDRKELAIIGLETVMKMIFIHDFVHGDLHPGNILIDTNPNTKKLRMNFIDCGLVIEMGESDHINLVKILGALSKRKGHLAGQLMVDTTKNKETSAFDIDLFCKGIETICNDDIGEHFMEKVGDYLTDICFLAWKHKVKLDPSFFNIALACEIVEGIASSLWPTMTVQKFVLPMVIEAEMMHGLRGAKRYFS